MGRQVEADRGNRFLDLYMRLLGYVNDEFGVIDGVASHRDVIDRPAQDIQPIREALYENDTERLIGDYVAENPDGLSAEELAKVEAWTAFEFGEFMVVRHLDDYAVFLEWEEPPRAFGVKAVWGEFAEFWSEGDLPLSVTHTVLLPFEERIVTDLWMRVRRIVFGGSMSENINDSYEEAKHRLGIIESLPPPTEEEKSDAEQLQFYMKNKRNRERYHEEIQELKAQSSELERIYHEELGKARARSLGRELRDIELNEAYFAIYDDRIIASGTTERQVQDVLGDIMPDGRETHPYIYHFSP